MGTSLDDTLLDTLTPEERAEIDGADDGERASLLQAGASKDPVHAEGNDIVDPGPEDDEDKDDEGDEGAEAAPAADATPAEPAAAAADAAAATPAAEPAPDATPEPAAQAAPAPAPQPAPAPVYRYDLPDDYEDRVKAATTAGGELLDKLTSGEMTREEYDAERVKLDEQRRELDSMRLRAELSADMQRQTFEAQRQAEISRVFAHAATADGGGIDYNKDEAKYRDLDTFVKALAQNPANADKPLGWFLDEGHRRVKLLHGIGDTPAPAAAAPAAQAPAAPAKPAAQVKAEAAAARKADTSAHRDLSQVPAADGGAADLGDEFEDVMSLEGQAFEDAIATMAKAQPQRWARFQSRQQ